MKLTKSETKLYSDYKKVMKRINKSGHKTDESFKKYIIKKKRTKKIKA